MVFSAKGDRIGGTTSNAVSGKDLGIYPAVKNLCSKIASRDGLLSVVFVNDCKVR